MKVIELRVENFRRLKAVSIRPNGEVVQVTGRNASGKTSVLDSIWVAIKGRTAAPPEPIRKGEEQARIRLDLGELVIVRTFERAKGAEYTQTLKVTRTDGSTVSRSPQAVLDSFVGALSFDPLAFARAKPSEQFDQLKALVPGFDFDANSAERKRLFDERTDVNRITKSHKAAAQNIVLPEGSKPEPINLTILLDELERIGKHNATAESITIKRGHLVMEAENKRNEAERLRVKATTLEREADAIDERLGGDLALAPKAHEDAGPVRARLGQAEVKKGIITLFEQREASEKAAAASEAKSEKITRKIEALDAAKVAAIERAKLPAGLGLGDGIATLNGLPLQQASDAEQLCASVEVAAALNPTLRVIRVHEGSLLDSKSLGAMAAMAKSRDMQLWIESVDETGEVGFYLENGEVAAVDGERVR